MAYEITITDTIDELTIDFPSPPLTESIIEGATDVQTLDLNVYTDFFANKRQWENTIAYMSEEDFNRLRDFYIRQFSLWQYPTISIPDLNVNDVVVRMRLSPKNVINNCGTVNNVGLTFRETVQITDDWGSS